jgi:hypothetical protein
MLTALQPAALLPPAKPRWQKEPRRTPENNVFSLLAPENQIAILNDNDLHLELTYLKASHTAHSLRIQPAKTN